MSERFARHELIPGWNQSALFAATVIVVGVGALGNEVSRLLASSGVGHMLLCDPDKVVESNLSRAPLFRPGDLGEFKVDAAQRTLEEFAPNVQIQTRAQPHVQGIGLAEIRDADLIVSCLDSRRARMQLASRCGVVQAAWIDGGTNAWGGEIRPFLDTDGPCYGCTLSTSERAEHDVPVSCHAPETNETVGASATISSVIASWMATHAARYLMGLPVSEYMQRINTENASMSSVQMERDNDCLFHDVVSDVRKVDVTNQDPIGKLREACPDGTPILWEPVVRNQRCPECDLDNDVWGPATASREVCPDCNKPMQNNTTIETKDVPEDVTLAQLGVPPAEIIAFRRQDSWQWVELEG